MQPVCLYAATDPNVVRLTVWSSGVMLYVMLACRYPVRLLGTALCIICPLKNL